MKKGLNLLAVFALAVVFISSAPTTSAQEGYTGPVTEIAVRQLNQDQDVAAFEEARDTFVALLKQQEGVNTDREFASFLRSPIFCAISRDWWWKSIAFWYSPRER